ncbi:MAG: DUF5655 domain-containing protein [Propionicimonas sp.]
MVGGEDEVVAFFGGSPLGLALYRAVAEAIASIGAADVRVTKSQIAFRRRRAFAYVWRPDRYLKSDVPAVLSIALPHEVPSPRFKQVAHPAPRVWMHHLELRDTAQIDDEVRSWLAAAFASAS